MKKAIVLGGIIMGFLFCSGRSEIDKILQIPENFQPSYTVVALTDVSYPAAIRKSVKIKVAKGMPKDLIKLNMKAAVKKYYEQFKPDAISVMVYFEGTPTIFGYDAGVCEFAPGGKWENAKRGTPLSQFGVGINIIKPKPKPPKVEIAATGKEYKIDLRAKKIASRKIKVDIDTNFPDGTIFWFRVFREYDVDYVGEIFKKDVTVKKGKLSLTISVSDREWYDEYMQNQKKLGKDLFGDIETIENDVTVSVQYIGGAAQTKSILEILGDKGQYIKGDGVKINGTDIGFEKEVKVNVPFKK